MLVYRTLLRLAQKTFSSLPKLMVESARKAASAETPVAAIEALKAQEHLKTFAKNMQPLLKEQTKTIAKGLQTAIENQPKVLTANLTVGEEQAKFFADQLQTILNKQSGHNLFVEIVKLCGVAVSAAIGTAIGACVGAEFINSKIQRENDELQANLDSQTTKSNTTEQEAREAEQKTRDAEAKSAQLSKKVDSLAQKVEKLTTSKKDNASKKPLNHSWVSFFVTDNEKTENIDSGTIKEKEPPKWQQLTQS